MKLHQDNDTKHNSNICNRALKDNKFEWVKFKKLTWIGFLPNKNAFLKIKFDHKHNLQIWILLNGFGKTWRDM
jgi:hypothetical protein